MLLCCFASLLRCCGVAVLRCCPTPLAGYLRPWPTVRLLNTGLLVHHSRLSTPSFGGGVAAVWIELYANEYKCQAGRVYICPASHRRRHSLIQKFRYIQVKQTVVHHCIDRPFVRVYDLGYGYGKTNHNRNFKARTVGCEDSREGWNRMLAANNLANSQRRNKGLQV